MADNKRRMITMPDGKRYPLMPKPQPNTSTVASRAAAQEVADRQRRPRNSEPDANIPAHSTIEPTTQQASYMSVPPVEVTRVVPGAQNSRPDAMPDRPSAEPTTHHLSQIGVPPVEATRVVPKVQNNVPDVNIPRHSVGEPMRPSVSQIGMPPVEATRIIPGAQNTMPDAMPMRSSVEPTTASVSQLDMPPVEASRVIPKKAENSVPDANIPRRSEAEPAAQQVSRIDMPPAPVTNQPVNATNNIFRGNQKIQKTQMQPNTNMGRNSENTQKGNYTPITSMEELAAAMGYTSPQEEERQRKASLMNQRILAVGDALRHIGNIANTVNYAPAQQFNSPVQEEQARYEKGKALRDRANQQYIAYQQAKAKQDAEQRRWEQQFNYNQAKDERNYKFNAAKAAAELAERQRQYDKTFGFNQQKHKDDVEYKNLTAKETARHHRALESTSRAGLAETIRHHKEVEANGGTAKGSFPVKSPYGKMRVPGRSIPQAQLNQAYKDFENAGWIKQDEFKKRMAEMGIGAKADPDYVRNRIIEEVISSNGEASDYMRDNFGWQYEDDSRGTGAMLMDEPQHATGLFNAPWNNNRGNPFEERQQPTNSNNHKSNPFG